MPGQRTCQLGRPYQAHVERHGGDPGYKAEPKSQGVWQGVGWSHSTVDLGDNITPGEGRAPAVGVIDWSSGSAYCLELENAECIRDLWKRLGEADRFLP